VRSQARASAPASALGMPFDKHTQAQTHTNLPVFVLRFAMNCCSRTGRRLPVQLQALGERRVWVSLTAT
jgi:hypothetical protein